MHLDWSERVCCIKGCESTILASGMCNKHWQRTRKYGSPVVVRHYPGMMRGLPAAERFARQVKKSIDCWLWSAAKDKDGYGVFRGEAAGVMHAKAHRWSWAHHNGRQIPDGMLICHSCDTPSCVNPAHLSLGTGAENQKQRWQRGRGFVHFGRRPPAAKLSDDEVREIRAATGRQADIGRRYGVSQTAVSDIKRRRSWAHVI